MALWQALLLGIVQGLTEFLPVSSTAHLILVPWLLGWHFPADAAFAFNVLVQDGTLLAVVLYFRRDLATLFRAALAGIARRAPLGTPDARLAWWIVLGTIPGVICGLAFKDDVKRLHGDPALVAGVLLVATGILFIGERPGGRTRGIETLTASDGLYVGVFQCLALVPGVSRSAATITGGLLRNLDRPAAARFSFLLSIPVLLGAGLQQTIELFQRPGARAEIPSLAVGFVAAAVVGYASIHWLLGFLARRPLTAFAPYRILAGGALLLVHYLRG
jgi:undecaprenyl-diphosphatase